MHLPSMLSQCLSCRNIPHPGWLCSSLPCWVLFTFRGWQFAFYYTFSSKYTAGDTTRSEVLLLFPPRTPGPVFYGIINVYGVAESNSQVVSKSTTRTVTLLPTSRAALGSPRAGVST